MKKLMALFLTIMLLISGAAAESMVEESANLTYEELEIYLAQLGKAALESKETVVSTNEEGLATAAFPGGVLVFDAANRTAVKMIAKTWLKSAKIKDVGAYFAVSDAPKEIGAWDSRLQVTSRGYMLGYRAIRNAGHDILPKADADFESEKYRKTCLRFFKLMCATSLGKL